MYRRGGKHAVWYIRSSFPQCKSEENARLKKVQKWEEHFKDQPSDLSNKALKTSFALFITDGFACFATKVHCLKIKKMSHFSQNYFARHLNSYSLAFSIKFCPIKVDMSGKTVQMRLLTWFSNTVLKGCSNKNLESFSSSFLIW